MFDYNGDGLLDLFFVNGAALGDQMSIYCGERKPGLGNKVHELR